MAEYFYTKWFEFLSLYRSAFMDILESDYFVELKSDQWSSNLFPIVVRKLVTSYWDKY